jgi:hypothetical protein
MWPPKRRRARPNWANLSTWKQQLDFTKGNEENEERGSSRFRGTSQELTGQVIRGSVSKNSKLPFSSFPSLTSVQLNCCFQVQRGNQCRVADWPRPDFETARRQTLSHQTAPPGTPPGLQLRQHRRVAGSRRRRGLSVILVDANLLLYAEDTLFEHHEAVRGWWDERLSGAAPVCLCWPVLKAFIRIGTNPRWHQRPLTWSTQHDLPIVMIFLR